MTKTTKKKKLKANLKLKLLQEQEGILYEICLNQ